jgi:FMN-dependent NADH-azoreductase
MKLLHIDTSIHPAGGSLSREMSRAVVERLRNEIPDLEVLYRDLAREPLPHLSAAVFGAIAGDADLAGLDKTTLKDVAASKAAMEEFLAADIILLGVPLYNLSVPSSLRAWIDRIVVFGKTFRYAGPNQPVGLASGKRVIVTLARGGTYADGSPTAQYEHAENYLRSVFWLIGINDVEFVIAEGVAFSPESHETARKNALDTIKVLAA